MEVVKVLVIVVTIIHSVMGQVPSSMGSKSPSSSDGHKYDLEIQRVELMNQTDFVVFQGLKVKRYNKTCEFEIQNES